MFSLDEFKVEVSGYDQLRALFPEEGSRCANCIVDGHCSCGKDK